MTSIPLALKYRPKTFEEVVGQGLATEVLSRMAEKNNLPNAMLFTGNSGNGKTTLARIIGDSYGEGSEVIEVDAASHGGVADIRDLTSLIRRSLSDVHLTVILDEAHSLTREAFNALLKTLEEVPDKVTIILVTTEPQSLPKTILSRTMEFNLRPISEDDVVERLTQVVNSEGIEDVSGQSLRIIAIASDGNLREALMMLDQTIRSGLTSNEDVVNLFGRKDYTPSLLAAILSGDAPRLFKNINLALEYNLDADVIAADLIDLLTDILILRGGGKITATGESLTARQALSHNLTTDAINAALNVLWDLQTKTDKYSSRESMLKVSLSLMSAAISRSGMIDQGPPEIESPLEDSNEVLSIEDMQSLVN